MSKLFLLALSPILACVFYVYIRDKYEKEPFNLLITGIIYGAVATVPIIHMETLMTSFMPILSVKAEAFYMSFLVAALVEEAMKYVVLFFLTWQNKNLNERFDGIVYSVFISLGFAGVENFLYVFNPDLGGMNTAITRAFISVPAHGFFGITMGYYFAMAKFEPEKRFGYLVKAFFITWIIHGLYDFILLSGMSMVMIVFIPFLIFLWINGFKKMKNHIEKSPFKGSLNKRLKKG